VAYFYWDKGTCQSYVPQPLRRALTLLRVVFGRFVGQIEFFGPILYKKRDMGIKVD